MLFTLETRTTLAARNVCPPFCSRPHMCDMPPWDSPSALPAAASALPNALPSAPSLQPVSVAVDSSSSVFQNYQVWIHVECVSILLGIRPE